MTQHGEDSGDVNDGEFDYLPAQEHDLAAFGRVIPDESTRFGLNEALLPVIARNYPVATNLDAAAAIETAIQGGYPDLPAAIAVPAGLGIAVDRLADSEGAIDGYRMLISSGGPWLAGDTEDVIDREPMHPDAEDGCVYDAAAIIGDAVAAANELLNWYEETAGPRSTAAWFAEARALGCTATGYSARDDTLLHAEGSPPCPLHEQPVQELVIECCEPVPYPRPGEVTRCGSCGTRFTVPLVPDRPQVPDPLPDGWREWRSPEGVSHAIPPAGPCATCGLGRHDNDQETCS